MEILKKIGVALKKTFKYTIISGTVITLITVPILAYKIKTIIDNAPVITEKMLQSEATSNMYDKNGELIWSQTDIRRNYIRYEKLPDLYVQLLLNTEDATYFQDRGISPKGTINAFVSFGKRGGSSIEQQLIKNVAFSSELKDRTVERKIKEFWLALQLDTNWSKEQILEWYVNKINMGEGSYGANTIAITYYGKPLDAMKERTPENIAHLAYIAGLGQAPSGYNAYDYPEQGNKRKNIVLQMAYENKIITKKEYNAAKKIDITQGLKERYWRNQEILSKVSQHNAYITSALKQLKDLGYDLEKTPIQIHTNMDSKEDNKLQSIVSDPKYYKNDGQQVAVTIVNPQTGAVIAQAGSRNQKTEEPYSYNRATQRTRSSGSTIKPFIDYAPAIEYLQIGSNYQLDSSPYQYPGTNIVAQNYGGYTYGIVDMKKALRLSLNTPAIRMLDNVVSSNMAKTFLKNINMDVKKTYGGADALGLNLSTADFASGFAAVANGGTYRAPNYINKLEFSDGSTKQIKPEEHRAMKASTAYILAKMMEGVPQDGGSAISAKIPEYKGYFVKTGTVGYDTSDGIPRPDLSASDSWMSGATKNTAISIWTGYDSPNEPDHWINADQTTRSDIFVAVMKAFNEGKDTSDFTKPDTVHEIGSGLSADYTPLDKTTIKTINPPEMSYIENTLADFNITSKTKVVGDDSANKTPSDYKEGAWNKDYKDAQRKHFDIWKSGKTLPTINDFINDKVWNQ